MTKILIGLVLVLVIVGGVFYFMQNKQPAPAAEETTNPSPQQKATNTSVPLTKEKVAAAVYQTLVSDKADWSPFVIKDGPYLSVDARSGTQLQLNDFAFGDINNDDLEDAVFLEASCGASCGFQLYVALQQPDTTLKIMAAGGVPMISSGAGKTAVQSISISDGKVSITARGFEGAPSYDPAITKVFTFDGQKFVVAQ